MSQLPLESFRVVALGIDFAILFATSFVMLKLADRSFAGDLALQSICVTLLSCSMFAAAKLYRIELIGNFRRQWLPLVQAWLALIAVVILIDAISRLAGILGMQGVPALWFPALLGWLTAAGGLLAVARFLVAMAFGYAVGRGVIAHRVVVVGANALASSFIRMTERARLGVRVEAVFDESFSAASPREVTGIPVSGGIDGLLAYSKTHNAFDVVIASPLPGDAIQALVARLSDQPLRIRLLPASSLATPGWIAPRGEIPGVQLLPLAELPIGDRAMLAKTLFDRLVAALLLVIVSPLLMVCAIGIKATSPGPVFFLQRRTGYRNAEFTVFKFRTMHIAACDTGALTARNDPRIFPFGMLLRKLSLDELPQLFNVLLGTMSLVGPRPHMAQARAAGQLYSDAIPHYASRHRVKPGITGFAQVSGWRGPTETLFQLEQRVAHDLHYIENWSFWLDIKILARTCVVGFFGDNAF